MVSPPTPQRHDFTQSIHATFLYPTARLPPPFRCSCQRCKGDNQSPKLFSSDNNMDPGSVPAELQGLTQTEEMLIARCCPIMRVLHLKGS